MLQKSPRESRTETGDEGNSCEFHPPKPTESSWSDVKMTQQQVKNMIQTELAVVLGMTQGVSCEAYQEERPAT